MTITATDEQVLYAKTIKLHTLDLGDGRRLRIEKTIEDDEEFRVHECDWKPRTAADDALFDSLTNHEQDEVDEHIGELI